MTQLVEAFSSCWSKSARASNNMANIHVWLTGCLVQGWGLTGRWGRRRQTSI